MIWVFKTFRILKTRETISYGIDNGIICYSCKEDIGYVFDKQNGTISIPDEKRQCLSCKRESNLDNIIGKRYIRIFDFIYSKKWNMIFVIITISSILIQILNIFLSISFLSITGGLLVNFANYGNYLNIKDKTRPKKTQSKD